MKKNILIGITGGIGSGKSLISDYLSGLGEYVIYADEVAREVVLPGQEGSFKIRSEFDEGYFLENGMLNRKKLAELVFSDSGKLSKLNGILHPLITKRIDEQAAKLDGRVFIEAPLLIQTGMHERMDFVWLVVADKQARIKRVVERDAVDASEVLQRMDCQLSDEEMAVYADEIIDNSTSVQSVYAKIDRLLEKPEYSGEAHGKTKV